MVEDAELHRHYCYVCKRLGADVRLKDYIVNFNELYQRDSTNGSYLMEMCESCSSLYDSMLRRRVDSIYWVFYFAALFGDNTYFPNYNERRYPDIPPSMIESALKIMITHDWYYTHFSLYNIFHIYGKVKSSFPGIVTGRFSELDWKLLAEIYVTQNLAFIKKPIHIHYKITFSKNGDTVQIHIRPSYSSNLNDCGMRDIPRTPYVYLNHGRDTVFTGIFPVEQSFLDTPFHFPVYFFNSVVPHTTLSGMNILFQLEFDYWWYHSTGLTGQSRSRFSKENP